jgi:hypothetical protein
MEDYHEYYPKYRFRAVAILLHYNYISFPFIMALANGLKDIQSEDFFSQYFKDAHSKRLTASAKER